MARACRFCAASSSAFLALRLRATTTPPATAPPARATPPTPRAIPPQSVVLASTTLSASLTIPLSHFPARHRERTDPLSAFLRSFLLRPSLPLLNEYWRVFVAMARIASLGPRPDLVKAFVAHWPELVELKSSTRTTRRDLPVLSCIRLSAVSTFPVFTESVLSVTIDVTAKGSSADAAGKRAKLEAKISGAAIARAQAARPGLLGIFILRFSSVGWILAMEGWRIPPRPFTLPVGVGGDRAGGFRRGWRLAFTR